MKDRILHELRERWTEVKRGLRLVVARDTPHRWRAVALLGALIFFIPLPGPFEELVGGAILIFVARRVHGARS